MWYYYSLFVENKTKTDSEKDKENAQMHALLGTICQIKKKKNSRKHNRMSISFRSLLRCIICCDSEKRSFIKIQLDFGDALLYMYHNTCFIGVYRIIQNIL